MNNDLMFQLIGALELIKTLAANTEASEPDSIRAIWRISSFALENATTAPPQTELLAHVRSVN